MSPFGTYVREAQGCVRGELSLDGEIPRVHGLCLPIKWARLEQRPIGSRKDTGRRQNGRSSRGRTLVQGEDCLVKAWLLDILLRDDRIETRQVIEGGVIAGGK